MRRRDVLALIGAAAWPPRGRTQPSDRMRRLGVLFEYAQIDPEANARLDALTAALKHLGWIEGRNLQTVQRFAGGEPDRIQALAAELVAVDPDVILGSGAPVTTALRSATQTTPIIFCAGLGPGGRRHCSKP